LHLVGLLYIIYCKNGYAIPPRYYYIAYLLVKTNTTVATSSPLVKSAIYAQCDRLQ